MTLFRSDVLDPLLNRVLRLRGGGLDEALAEAKERLDGGPWMWRVGEDSDPGIADQLLARGATQVGTMPVMAVRTGRVREVVGPPGLSIEEVDGPDELGEWVAALAPPSGIAADQVDSLANRPHAPGQLVRLAGRVDGEVVGSSMLYDRDGVAGIYVVATVEGHERRGIGTAMTAAAVRAGHERGLRVASLQSSPVGRPVYERMGFETV